MDLRQYTLSDLSGARVLLRLDLDVETNEEGLVDEWHDLRLERAVSTVKSILEAGVSSLTLCGHRGRPSPRLRTAAPAGKFAAEFSLKPVKDRLEVLLSKEGVKEPIDFQEDLSGSSESKLVLLENLRFYPGEQANSSEFAKNLARWGDVYINDAFGVCHRSEASLVAITQVLTSSFAGPNVVEEASKLSSFVKNAGHPFVVILGGIKISTKLPLIKRLLNTADVILLGGGLANTVLAARGLQTGLSVIEPESFSEARNLDSEVLLPKDLIIRDRHQHIDVVNAGYVGEKDFILDIGPEAIKEFSEKIHNARSILWNGPMGKFEDKDGREGTEVLAEAMVRSNANTLIGGGETVVAAEQLKLTDKFGFVSAGGGAMLTFLAGKPLPALDVLYK